MVEVSLLAADELQAEHTEGYRRVSLNLRPDAVKAAMSRDKATLRILAGKRPPAIGDVVGVRLNLNFLRATGLAVHTVHAATNKAGYRVGRGFWTGEVLAYEECVTLTDAYFNVSQTGRERIASGSASKFPMASIDGRLEAMCATDTCEGVPVSFNPHREHLFRLPDGRAIWRAERVTICGHRAYASGTLVLHSETTAPKRAGAAPSAATIHLHRG